MKQDKHLSSGIFLYIYIMKVYLRLFFIELFIFIGLVFLSERPEDVKKQNQDPHEIGHVQFQPCLLPVFSRATPAPSFFSNCPVHSDTFSRYARHIENLITKRIGNQFSTINANFANRKPELVFKTGLILQTLTNSEDPLYL